MREADNSIAHSLYRQLPQYVSGNVALRPPKFLIFPLSGKSPYSFLPYSYQPFRSVGQQAQLGFLLF